LTLKFELKVATFGLDALTQDHVLV